MNKIIKIKKGLLISLLGLTLGGCAATNTSTYQEPSKNSLDTATIRFYHENPSTLLLKDFNFDKMYTARIAAVDGRHISRHRLGASVRVPSGKRVIMVSCMSMRRGIIFDDIYYDASGVKNIVMNIKAGQHYQVELPKTYKNTRNICQYASISEVTRWK